MRLIERRYVELGQRGDILRGRLSNDEGRERLPPLGQPSETGGLGRPSDGHHLPYPCRSVLIGSTRLARRTGTKLANTAVCRVKGVTSPQLQRSYTHAAASALEWSWCPSLHPHFNNTANR